MKLFLPVRRDAGDDEPVLGMRPNQIAIRIGAAARQAGLGEDYSGDSPRLKAFEGVVVPSGPCTISKPQRCGAPESCIEHLERVRWHDTPACPTVGAST